MSTILVGIVDYGVGNHASVMHVLEGAGFRAKVSSDFKILDSCDLLLLPGVGAFPAAMKRLSDTGLDTYIYQSVQCGQPLLGICLGMQLLASESLEMGRTRGLNIIPGRVVPLGYNPWHIGWNSLECIRDDRGLRDSHGEYFYFNHSFKLVESSSCVTAQVNSPLPITSAVRLGRVGGLQFHPEKSQRAGIILIHNLVRDLVNA